MWKQLRLKITRNYHLAKNKTTGKYVRCIIHRLRFPNLDNVYEVLRMNSVFRDYQTDEVMRKFYKIVDTRSKKIQEKVEILLLTEKINDNILSE